MLLYDELYGEYVIEDVLAELVRSLPVQRLKGVHQGGASCLVNPDWNVTRYEHSIGVMLLIRRLGGSVEEQIAGLLHDVSHTAFSHVIDLVLEYPEENYHELIFQKVIANSEIPSILKNYHYRDKDILHDDSKWTLLEQSAPQLCADRIDYTLRDMYQYGKITLQEAHEFLEHLTVINGRIYIKDIQAAEWFVETYYKEVIDFFMNPLNVYGYVMLTDVLKTALTQNVLNEEDFLGTDQEILAKIKAEGSDRLPSLLQKISEKVILEENPKDYDIHHKGKVRLIDPSVVTEHGLVKASKLSEKIRSQGEAARCKAVEGIFLKVQKQ